MGIIDILQVWNWDKRLEHLTKTKILKKDKRGISAVEPNWYQDRFMRFMRQMGHQQIKQQKQKPKQERFSQKEGEKYFFVFCFLFLYIIITKDKFFEKHEKFNPRIFSSTTHRVHIWPPPDEIEMNVRKARETRGQSFHQMSRSATAPHLNKADLGASTRL